MKRVLLIAIVFIFVTGIFGDLDDHADYFGGVRAGVNIV